jgi:SM-20-related protein
LNAGLNGAEALSALQPSVVNLSGGAASESRIAQVGNLQIVSNDAPATKAHSASDIAIHNDFLGREDQQAILSFLRGPGWGYGAFSDPASEAPRYWYKHFAGYVKDGRETHDLDHIENELASAAPLVSTMWRRIQSTLLPGHALTRCYTNGYPFGAEGGLHLDSNIASHPTVLYYPHVSWHPNYSGQTVFFDTADADIIASVFPRPSRLAIFPGTIPHVARGISRRCPKLRMTLMFKTAPR